MSQETKNRFIQLYRYIIREFHRGNFIPLVITALVSWYVIYPAYKYVGSAISNLFEVDNYVLSNQGALEARIKELEDKVDNQFKSRPDGSGYTSF